MIEQSTHNDVKKIAQCHRKAFPKSYATQLGQSYCEKMISWFLSTDKSFLFHLEKDGLYIGYVGGVLVDNSTQIGPASAMMQFCFNKAIHSLFVRPWLIFHKEVFKNFSYVFQNILIKLGLKKRKQSNTKEEQPEKVSFAGILVIGVDPLFQGKGYGSILQQEFERKAKSIGKSELQLTVKPQNEKAIKSYKSNGWTILRESKNDIRMIKKLN